MDNNNVKIAIGADNATADRPLISSDQRSIGAYHDDRHQPAPIKIEKNVGADQRLSAPTRWRLALVGADRRWVGDCTLCPFAVPFSASSSIQLSIGMISLFFASQL